LLEARTGVFEQRGQQGGAHLAVASRPLGERRPVRVGHPRGQLIGHGPYVGRGDQHDVADAWLGTRDEQLPDEAATGPVRLEQRHVGKPVLRPGHPGQVRRIASHRVAREAAEQVAQIVLTGSG
jgi:hypothetical protein